MGKIQTRKDSFVQSTDDGAGSHIWLCLSPFRANQLFQERIYQLDPFGSDHARRRYLSPMQAAS